jgi:hypothetical protein
MTTMDQNAVNSRIAASIARRAGASSSEQFPISVEQGTEPLRNRVGAGQIDSTVRFSEWREPEKRTGYRPADEKNVDPVEPEPDTIISIGNVTIRPNPIAGTFEGKFTRNGNSPHEVLIDGQRVLGDGAISAVYNALRAQQQQSVRKTTKEK